MKKLIATEFDYQYRDAFDGSIRKGRGSYLGRTLASRPTLMKFMRENFKKSNLAARIVSVKIAGSYESRWVAK